VLAARSLPSLTEGQEQSLKLIAGEIVKKQQPDGSWEFFATLRPPPINESQTTDAAGIILALQGATGPGLPPSQRAALSKAVAWLDAARPSDFPQDKVLKVLLGVRSGKPRAALPVRHLIILPSALTALVPVEALLAAQAEPQAAYTVSYAPSGTMFAWLQDQRRAARAPAPAWRAATCSSATAAPGWPAWPSCMRLSARARASRRPRACRSRSGVPAAP
jgi:hypothetical protein